MEKIPVHPRSVAEFFAIEAWVHAQKSGVVLENDRPPDGTIHVTFIVEGVEISFTQTIERVYKRMEDTINERAAKLAYETAQLKGLDELNNMIQQYSWALRDKIENIFGVKLED